MQYHKSVALYEKQAVGAQGLFWSDSHATLKIYDILYNIIIYII